MSSIPLQTRREFCTQACQAASLVVVGSVAAGSFAGCGKNPNSPSSTAPPLNSVSGTVSGRTISIAIGSGSALAAAASAATVQTSLGAFLVSRTGQDSFTALTAICTHEGCTISGFENSQYVCPCHGSRFTTAGSVANGPANRSLQQYPTQFVNGVLTFTV